jgi:phospholipid/cholesterol/gamma-HCH transport system substrate-binding protein
MNETSTKRRVIVGLFILVGIILLLGGIMIIGNLHETFIKKVKVIAIFEDVNGLQSGNNVWFSGVKIGTVSRMQFYGESQVKVTMRLEEKSIQYVRKDSKVRVGSDGLIGNKIIVISGGTTEAGPVEEGDTLGIEKVVSTDDIMNTFQENNKNFLEITNDFKTISRKLAKGEGTVGRLLDNDSLYFTIAQTIASLNMASLQARTMMNNLSAYTERLNRKGTLLNELTSDTEIFQSFKSTVSKLDKISDTASALISNLKQASSDPQSPIGVLLHDQQSGASLKSAIRNLESGSKKLDEDLEALRHTFLLRRQFKNK